MAASAKEFPAETETEERHLDFNAGEYTFFIESATSRAAGFWWRRELTFLNQLRATDSNETFVSCVPLA